MVALSGCAALTSPTSSVALPTGASAPATIVVTYEPGVPDEVQEGTCFARSITVTRVGAYRCTVGNAGRTRVAVGPPDLELAGGTPGSAPGPRPSRHLCTGAAARATYPRSGMLPRATTRSRRG